MAAIDVARVETQRLMRCVASSTKNVALPEAEAIVTKTVGSGHLNDAKTNYFKSAEWYFRHLYRLLPDADHGVGPQMVQVLSQIPLTITFVHTLCKRPSFTISCHTNQRHLQTTGLAG